MLHLTKHLNLLNGLAEANALVVAMIEGLDVEGKGHEEGRGGGNQIEQLERRFVAGDGSRGVRSLFVPPEFAALCGLVLIEERRSNSHLALRQACLALLRLLTPRVRSPYGWQLTSVDASARELDVEMRGVIAQEGWPPPAHAMRTRVRTDGSLACHSCSRTFSKSWCFR